MRNSVKRIKGKPKTFNRVGKTFKFHVMIKEIKINGEVKRFIRIITYLDGKVIGYTIGNKERINLTCKKHLLTK